MKIYTKTGDKGMTSLVGGTRVAKNSVRLEAYGGVDELNSYLGFIRSFEIDTAVKQEIIAIQNILFSVGGNLATDTTVEGIKAKLVVTEEEVIRLEQAMDKMDMELPPLTSFHSTRRGIGCLRLSYCPDGMPESRKTDSGCSRRISGG